MSHPPLSILLVGGTGSVGRHVARHAQGAGHRVRVLTRRPDKAPDGTVPVEGDLTEPATLAAAVEGVDAVVFTHGAAFGSSALVDVDYGGVLAVLEAIGSRPVRIALMTTIGVTQRGSDLYDWKRRSERLVRASGHPYTIVRPGWFDLNDPDQLQVRFLQGDRRWSGSPADGVIARSQIAEVLVWSLTSDAAVGKTFELVAEHGPATHDLDPLFAELVPDDALDPRGDVSNMPLESEPAVVRDDLQRVADHRRR